ncbi:MAG: ABC transporter ATP-binding protein [Yaniella sp.]|uniref:ABC transporter ATP-binding protein n=1 Tax=Yaniella sp. TaxID=2773929 RepID=UPI002649DBCA|nr:ABC transporter ATP-binding protein [Yaniella sp.]MDN5732035.1 ABC transporter ATP-binding protein [Yaniella sp.]MDN5742300.1 ABC transporter ATP-binding protein [Yaniella sp.]MDN5816071.1 ABC transporter ATP-binding protein [Yaniella sp.]MDN5818217.1 ABC transporter ATP-binding protein [Yaniella sp.]MDN5838087.1 ABC transporter ATP-binding protein [Yaniella sp.]
MTLLTTHTQTPPVTASAITLEGLGKSFADTEAVADLNLSLPAGSFLVLLGPSGCGKTTTLRMIAGLEDPSRGRITFGEKVVADGDTGSSLPTEKRGIGMVFQSYALWPHMTVRANVEWPLKVGRWDTDRRRTRSEEVLSMLGIDHLADRYPTQLSGGQQQRVAIARTIAPSPSVVLFDEPLSNLDARLRVDTRSELVDVHRASGATSVYVTHDQIEALAMATHIAVLRDGRLEQFGTPDELLTNPKTAFVAGFLGNPAAVLIDGTMQQKQLTVRDQVLAAPLPVKDGTPMTAMYRPDSIGFGTPDGIGLEIMVMEATPAAGRYVITARLGKERISVVSTQRHAVGEQLKLLLPPEPAAVFDADGQRWDTGHLSGGAA